MSGHGWRPHLESALALDIGRMHKAGALHNGKLGTWQWTRDGERVATIGYRVALQGEHGTLTLDYTHADRDGQRTPVQCIIRLSSIPLHYGGCRWYGHCPATGRRARKLYKYSGIAPFCHRTAFRPLPTYASQRDSGSERVTRQRWALRRKIGDDFSDLFGEPLKPKWMRRRTFERYAERDAALAERDNGYLLRLIGRLR